MMRQASWVVRGVALVACSTSLQAAEPRTPAECSGIADNTLRLACYDANFKKAPAAEGDAEPGQDAAAGPAGGGSLPADETPVGVRERAVRELQSDWFAITPYRTNYILPVTWRRNT